jgi:hypothetical protein
MATSLLLPVSYSKEGEEEEEEDRIASQLLPTSTSTGTVLDDWYIVGWVVVIVHRP